MASALVIVLSGLNTIYLMISVRSTKVNSFFPVGAVFLLIVNLLKSWVDITSLWAYTKGKSHFGGAFLKNTSTRELILVSLFTALTAVSAYMFIPLPISPVPITAQTLMLMLCGSILPPKHAFWSMASLLLLGAAGLPVFSGGGAGFGKLFGPTGGYLLSMPLAVYISASLLKKIKPTFWALFLTNLLGGLIIVYIFGVTYLAFSTSIGFTRAFMIGALPFIPGDLFKVIIATVVARALRRSFPFLGLFS